VSSNHRPRGARLDEACSAQFSRQRPSLLAAATTERRVLRLALGRAVPHSSSHGAGVLAERPRGPSVFSEHCARRRVQYKATARLVLRAAVLNGTPYNRAGENATTPQRQRRASRSPKPRISSGGKTGAEEPEAAHGRFSGAAPYDDKYAIASGATRRASKTFERDGAERRARGSIAARAAATCSSTAC